MEQCECVWEVGSRFQHGNLESNVGHPSRVLSEQLDNPGLEHMRDVWVVS